MVTTSMAKEADGNFSCYCNVTTNPGIANEICCHYACCYDIQHITNVQCAMYPDDCDDASVFVQDPSVIVMTESTNDAEPTTEETLNSTTVADGGSTPTRGDHGLATVAAAIVIFIHIRGQAQFL